MLSYAFYCDSVFAVIYFDTTMIFDNLFFLILWTGQKIQSIQSKIVVVIWCLVLMILVQSYTASLSSMLTAERLQPSVTDLKQLLANGDFVGYQKGSFVHSMLKKLKFDDHKIKVYSTQEEYAKALRMGSKHGGVSAIFDEIPYLNSFCLKYGREFQMVGPIDRTSGFGFVSFLHLLFISIMHLRAFCLGFTIYVYFSTGFT